MLNPSTDAQIRRMLEGRNRVLERVAMGTPLPHVLRLLTEACEELDPEVICAVLLIDLETGCLVQCGKSRLPSFYVRATDGLRPGPSAGSCGTAAYTRRRVIVSDIPRDPLWEGLAELAAEANLRACWSQPIASSGGGVLGTFAMYYATPHRPTPRDIHFMEGSAHIASLAIEHSRTVQELSQYRARLQALVEERTAALEKSNEELRNALHEVQTLSGLLPICASCKAVRNDSGYWEEIESYITAHSCAEFSHGICPDCARRLYPRHSEAPSRTETRESEIRAIVAARRSS